MSEKRLAFKLIFPNDTGYWSHLIWPFYGLLGFFFFRILLSTSTESSLISILFYLFFGIVNLIIVIFPFLAIGILFYDRPMPTNQNKYKKLIWYFLTVFRRLFRFVFFVASYFFIFLYGFHLMKESEKNVEINYPYDYTLYSTLQNDYLRFRLPTPGDYITQIPDDLRTSSLIFLATNDSLILYEKIPPERRPSDFKAVRYIVKFLPTQYSEQTYATYYKIRKSFGGEQVLEKRPLYRRIQQVEIYDKKINKSFIHLTDISPTKNLIGWDQRPWQQATERFLNELEIPTDEKNFSFPDFEKIFLMDINKTLSGIF